ncbi:uncharacterized protein LOC123532227 [Mercenaria mercenaria]|uniref:uncharacterized protein LOC123532227 n=1 Tax=Mercenaria mercenaria TaxID=6596 RepID=UPI00234E916B|nr:uncharacterized protein LOC123532227 [Mercenaria mercenaria]
MENETLSQMMNSYDVQLTDNTFGNFNLRLNDVTGDTTGTLDDSSVVKSEEPDRDSSLTDRFATETTCEDANALINELKSKNTVRNTKWAYTVFESWRDTRNKSGHEIPELSNMTVDDMNTYLCRFVMETRKRDGTKYPPNSLYHIMSGLLRYLRDKNINDKNFLDQADPRFSYLNKVLNSEMKKLTSEGLALPQREALPVTETDERQIWEKGVFGDFDAISLQRTVFFIIVKYLD